MFVKREVRVVAKGGLHVPVKKRCACVRKRDVLVLARAFVKGVWLCL